MTKSKNDQRYIKNRTWEKDRRDRLNNTFERLAKLLPEYQPKVTFSKIEILQKTIVYVDDLRAKVRELLSNQNASILKTQEELEDGLKALVLRNNDLIELLEKANIKVPPFIGPKLLSFIVTVHNGQEICEQNVEHINNNNRKQTKTNKKSVQQNGEKIKENEKEIKQASIEKVSNALSVNCGENGKNTNTDEASEGTQPAKSTMFQKTSEGLDGIQKYGRVDFVPVPDDLGEIQKYGSVDVIPVANATITDPKIRSQSIKNSVEITPVLANLNENATALKAVEPLSEINSLCPIQVDNNTLENKTSHPTIVATPIANIPKQTPTKPFPFKTIDGKVAIPAIKNGIVKKRNKRVRRKKQEIEALRSQLKDESQSNKDLAIPNVTPAQNDAHLPVLNKKNKNLTIKSACSTGKVEKIVNEASVATKEQHNVAASSVSEKSSSPLKRFDSNITNKECDLNAESSEKDLTYELFESLQLSVEHTANGANPNSMSPTAAFLLSFPVVSTIANVKPTETESHYSNNSNLLHLTEKSSHPNDQNLFDNLQLSLFNVENAVTDCQNNQDCKTIPATANSHSTSHQYSVESKIINRNDEKRKNIATNKCNTAGKVTSETSLVKNTKTEVKKSLSTEGNSVHKFDKTHPNVKQSPRKSSTSEIKKQNIAEPLNSAQFPKSSKTSIAAKAQENTSIFTETAQCSNPFDFYGSPWALGLPNKTSFPSTSITPSVSTSYNFQIPSLSQPRKNPIESTTFIAEPPFTFSLTSSAENTMVTTTCATATNYPSQNTNQNQISNATSKTPKKSSPTKHSVSDRFGLVSEPSTPALNRYNTYNPFLFDNQSVLSTPSSMPLSSLTTSSITPTISAPFTFTLTPTWSSNPITASKMQPQPTSITTQDPSFSSFDVPAFNYTPNLDLQFDKKCSALDNKIIQKADHQIPNSIMNAAKDKEKSKLSSGQSGDSKKSTERLMLNSFDGNSDQNVKNSTPSKSVKSNSKNLVNWMTSLASNKSELDSSFDFTATATQYSSHEDNMQWSPNRIIETANFIPTPVLPTLHGDLALNTISGGCANISKSDFMDGKKNNSIKLPTNRKLDLNTHQDRASKYHRNERNSYQTQVHPPSIPLSANDSVATNSSTFFSVSQLVDQERQQNNKHDFYNQYDQKVVPANINKSKECNNHKQRHCGKSMSNSNQHTNNGTATNAYMNTDPMSLNDYQKHSNILNYSAEALISNAHSHPLFNTHNNSPKRLKSNYTSAGTDYFNNQNNNTNYDHSAGVNDIYTPYSLYQTFDNDFETGSSSYINSITNQSYSHPQYSQSQHQLQQHQQLHTPYNQNNCDPIDTQFSPPLVSHRTQSSHNFTQNPTLSSSSAGLKHPQLTDNTSQISHLPPTFRDNPTKQNNNYSSYSSHHASKPSHSGNMLNTLGLPILSASTSNTEGIPTLLPNQSKSDFHSSKPDFSNKNSNARRYNASAGGATKPIQDNSYNSNFDFTSAWNPQIQENLACIPMSMNPYPIPVDKTNFCGMQSTDNSAKIINSNISGNSTITNFDLRTICPEISHDKQSQRW